jgi:hypothetical protein
MSPEGRRRAARQKALVTRLGKLSVWAMFGVGAVLLAIQI